MNQVQTEVIFLNLLRQADEFIFSILGMNPTPDSGSFRARVSALFDMFKADKYNFVLSPVHLGFLATLIKEYGAVRKSEITQIGTPEILIGQIRWEDIYDKPATMPPATHQHVKAEISDFPATMTPTEHQHVKADISDFPATMTPTEHQHAYADITERPATFAPRHAKATYVGNGAGTRTLYFAGGFTPMFVIISTSTSTDARIAWSGYGLTNVGNDTVTLTIMNVTSANYLIISIG